MKSIFLRSLFLTICFSISISFLAQNSFGKNGFKVQKVNSEKTRAIVSGEVSFIKTGDQMHYEKGTPNSCVVPVIKVNEKSAVVDITLCHSRKTIKSGASLNLVGTTVAVLALSPFQKAQLQQSSTPPAKTHPNLPSINESWYTLWGLGYSSVSYGSEFQTIIDPVKSDPTVENSIINMDIFGFYWPRTDHKSMHGVIVNTTSDLFKYPSGEFTIRQSLLAYSNYYFFGQNIGNAWFLRGDIGIAWYSIDATFPDGTKFSAGSDKGWGVLAGGGYSFIIGNETRMPLGLYIAHRDVEEISSLTTSLNLSFLF